MKINVPHIAKLANLPISEGETTMFEKQLSDVLEYVKKLDEANTEHVQETSQVTGLENVTREDKTAPSLTQDSALSGSHATKQQMFQVKGILKEE